MPELPVPLTPDEWLVVNSQRAITAAINRDVVKVGAIYLRPTSKIPANDDWPKSKYLDTNLAEWVDNENLRYSNVGFNLQQGWVDVDIDGDDSEYHRCIHRAMVELGIDCRLAFGRRSAGVPRHFLVQLPEEESQSFAELKRFEPSAINLGNRRFRTEIRSSDEEADARQTVVPGSMYSDGSGYDMSVWWTDEGRIAKSIGELTQTTPRVVNFTQLIRAIAFGTILFLIKPHWVAGTRQNTAIKFNGWLARVVGESFAINNSEQLSAEVFCPIDSDDIAQALIELICKETGDDEAFMRKRTYKDARRKLEQNPDAKIPGWPAIAELLGEEVKIALQNICRPGTETNILMQLVAKYVYNKNSGRYIDREEFRTSVEKFEFDPEDLYRLHKSDVIKIAGKSREAFKSFEMSKLRVIVSEADLYPTKPPGTIFRTSRSQGMVPEEFEGDDSHLIFNTWRGWDVKLPATVNHELLVECDNKLNRILGWLTRDNVNQIQWIKEWIAWTIQRPGDKQQIAWVVLGGQGVGKSFFGGIFCQSLFGGLHNTIASKLIGEKFSTAPLVNRMFIFADEVRFRNKGAIDEIKLYIRNIKTPGELKGIDARSYNIYARWMFASNNMDIRISEESMLDRALFFTKAYTHDFMGLNQLAFHEWTLTLKPFFDEFGVFLKRADVREHYMYYFMNMPINRHTIEDIKWSSSRDPDIIIHNLSQPLRVAKIIIENGCIVYGNDISTPFSRAEFLENVTELCKKIGEDTRANLVLQEFERLGLTETIFVRGMQRIRFRWMLGTLMEKFSEAVGVPCNSSVSLDVRDYGENTNDGARIVDWRHRAKF